MNRNLEVSSVITLPLLGRSVNFQIMRIIGIGGSCIAYETVYCEDNDITHKCIIKEFCPVYLESSSSPLRDGQSLQVPEEYRDKFNDDVSKFKCMYRDINYYLADNPSATKYHPILLGICEANNTVYTMTSYDHGRSYDKIEDSDLHTVLKLMLTVTKAVEQYHKANYLHLDIKPKNILILEGVSDIVKLFDYDSLTPIDAFRNKTKLLVPSPEDYYVPELSTCNVSAIGIHTDIFEIAAMLFLRLFGRAPTNAELQHKAKIKVDDCPLLKSTSHIVKYELESLFEHTLKISKWDRYQTTAELKEHLQKLIRLTSGGNEVYLMDMPKWQPSAFSVGRRDSLKELDRLLDEHGFAFIRSIGGLGKSELAKMYVKAYSSKYHTVQFCKYSTSLLELVAGLPVKGINDEDYKNWRNLAKEKLKVLQASDNRTLLIIDNFNVTHDEHLRDFLPVNNRSFKVIFTTRCIPAVNYYRDKVLALSKLSHDECKQLFCLHSDIPETSVDASLDKLIDTIDRNTLILILIASTIRQSGISVQEMLHKLESNTLSEVQTKVFHDYDISGEETVSYNKIYSHLTTIFNVSSLESDESEILKCMSLIPMEGIKLDTFVSYCDTPSVTSESVNKLIDSGWIQRYNDTEITIHPLVSDILADDDSLPIGDCYNNLVENLENYCFPDIMDHITVAKQKLSYALHLNRRFANEPYDRRVLVKAMIGRSYTNTCNLNNAKKYFLECIEMEMASRSHSLTPQIYYLLGEAERMLGSLKEAIKYYELSIREGKRITNRDYNTVLDSMTKIAYCYSDNHNHKKAYSLLVKAYRYAKFHSLTDNVYDICKDIIRLCAELDLEKKAQKYKEIIYQSFPEYSEDVDDDEEDDDKILQNALSIGDFEAAFVCWEEMCAKNKRIFGEESPIYKNYYNKYRWLYCLMAGNTDESQRLISEHLAFIETTFGTKSMEMAKFLSMISEAYLNFCEDIDYSIQCVQRAIDICTSINERDSYTYFEANLILANCLITQSRVYDAKAIVDKLDVRMFNGSEAVSDFSTTYALLLCEFSEYEKAEHHCKLILKKQNLTPFEHSQAKFIMSICCEQRGNLEMAQQYADSALEYISTLKESYAKDQWLFKLSRVKAKIQYRRGNFINAINILTERYNSLRLHSTLRFALLLERGMYYSCNEDYDSAMKDFNDAEQILNSCNMPDESYITLYNNIATTYINTGNYKKGRDYLERIIAIRPQILDATTSLGIIVCHNYGYASLCLNDIETADKYIKKAAHAHENLRSGNLIENCTFKFILAMLYEAKQEYDLCIETLTDLFDDYAPEYDPTAQALMKYQVCFIRVLIKTEGIDTGVAYIEKYDDMYSQRFGDNSEQRIMFLVVCASMFLNIDLSYAYNYFCRINKLIRNSHLNETILHAQCLNGLAVCLINYKEDYKDAIEQLTLAKEIYKVNIRTTDPAYKIVLENIAYASDLLNR